MRIMQSQAFSWARFGGYLAGILAMLCAQAAPMVTTVDSGVYLGTYTSMRLNGGKPVVSYYDNTNGNLKLATCTAACDTSMPAWVVVTVDSDGDVGWYTSLQLNGGNPVIAYYAVGARDLKLATCTAACSTATPTWIIVTVDSGSPDMGRFPSLQLNGGNPVISYRDKTNGDLKLATCTAGCATEAPTWLITTVDSAGDVGRYTSMQLNGGRPVISYFDLTNGTVKLATCSEGCATATPTWVITVIDTVPGDIETQLSLQLNGGNPVVSYYEALTGDLKLATCTAGCGTATPAWIITTVDSNGDAGEWSSLRLYGGKPVVSYYGSLFNCTHTGSVISCSTAGDLRLATCTAGCATATPTWVIKTLDNGTGVAGWDSSLQLDGDRIWVSYHDAVKGTLKLVLADINEYSLAPNHTALWWNFDESGWGVNFAHQGDTVFATFFTYDAAGNPMWLVSTGAKQSADTFSGTLYRTTGPPFDANPFTPIGPSNYTEVGTMTVSFSGDSASLAFSVGAVTVNKTIRKLVFGAHAATCWSTSSDRKSLGNYQDLWWNAAESGWGVNLTHQGDSIFATLFTYDANGLGLWLSSGLAKQPDGSYLGDLYRTTGPAFNAAPFTPIGPANYTKVGTMQLRFANAESGTLTYSVNGVTVVKSVARILFASPVPACSG